MSDKTRASLSVLLAGALWGGIGLFFRMLQQAGLANMQSVAVRVMLSAVLYTVFLFLTDRAALKIRPRDIWCFIGTGIVSLVLFNFCYFNAITLSGSMGVAAVLLYTAPIFVMLMSALFFGEKLGKRKMLALLLTFLGCLLVTGVLQNGAAIAPLAILYGLGSGFFYALYSIFGKFALARYSSKTITVYSFLCGAAALIPFAKFSALGGLFTPSGIFGALGLSVVCCILPYVFYTAGLRVLEPGRASMLATIEPVVAALLGVVVFHERVTGMMLLGALLVVAAICLLNFERKHKDGAPSK